VRCRLIPPWKEIKIRDGINKIADAIIVANRKRSCQM
jgi:hypothetical protein